MKFKFLENHLGVSPTVGVILMVAITVVLAVTVGFVVLDLGDSTSQNARAGVSIEETPDGVQVTANNLGGNTEELQVLVDGEPVEDAVLTSAGDSVTVAAVEGSTVSVRGTTSTGSSSNIQSVSTSSNTTTDGTPSLISSSGSDGGTNQGELNGPVSSPQSEPEDLAAVYNNMTQNSNGWYIINNSQQLQAVDHNSETLSQKYILGQNIDASNTSDWNSDSGFDPIANFTGVLDGNGYVIQGLTIDRGSQNYVGLIGMNVGTVENVQLRDVDITGNSKVGGLVGKQGYIGIDGNSIDGYIYNSSVTGTVSGSSNNVGGFIGDSNYGDIFRSFADVEVHGSGSRVGGFVGVSISSGSTIKDSYSSGAVIAPSGGDVGGFAGELGPSQIYTSYATGNVTSSDTFVGGFGGRSPWSVDRPDTYWDMNTTGQNTSVGGTGLTTSEMTGSDAKDNMDFNFNSTWTTTDNYPILSWQNESE